MGMTAEEQKQQLSFAYVHAVASRAGYQVERPPTDYDSIDLRISGWHPADSPYPETDPMIGIQVKSTAIEHPTDKSHFPFRLPIKTYNDLKKSVYRARFLIVLLLPADERLWIEQSSERMISRSCAYFLSLRGMPDRPKTRAKDQRVTVHVPWENRFTIAWLEKVMTDACWGRNR